MMGLFSHRGWSVEQNSQTKSRCESKGKTFCTSHFDFPPLFLGCQVSDSRKQDTWKCWVTFSPLVAGRCGGMAGGVLGCIDNVCCDFPRPLLDALSRSQPQVAVDRPLRFVACANSLLALAFQVKDRQSVLSLIFGSPLVARGSNRSSVRFGGNAPGTRNSDAHRTWNSHSFCYRPFKPDPIACRRVKCGSHHYCDVAYLLFRD